MSSRRVTGLAFFGLGIAALPAACTSLIGANFDRSGSDDGSAGGDVLVDGAVALDDSGHPVTSPDGSTSGPDGSAEGGTTSDAGDDDTTEASTGDDGGGATYDSAQAALESAREVGPTTPQGSTGYCTEHHFVWKESNGALHSWRVADGFTLDYGFRTNNLSTFYPGETYIAVYNADGGGTTDVYQTNATNTQVASLPYRIASAALDDGLFLVKVTGSLGDHRQVQRWFASDGGLVNVGDDLATGQPPVGFGLGELVIPGDVTAPFPLYETDTDSTATTTVTFADGGSLSAAVPTVDGVLVSYLSGSTPALRLYGGNDSSAGEEIGDEIDALPNLFSDSPAGEHRFLAHVDATARVVVFGTTYGIFAYNWQNKKMSALALGPNKSTYLPDTLCVVPGDQTLMYRLAGEATGQVYALPLAGLLP